MRVTFVVKGRECLGGEVFRQLKYRGIHAHQINATATETVFQSDSPVAELDMLRHWFCEQPALIPGYGYPDGTLLIYSIHNDEQQAKLTHYQPDSYYVARRE